MRKKKISNPQDILKHGPQTITFYLGKVKDSYHATIDVRPESDETRILDGDYKVIAIIPSVNRWDVHKALRALKRQRLMDEKVSQLVIIPGKEDTKQTKKR